MSGSRRTARWAVPLALIALAATAPAAGAAGPPQVEATWTTEVVATSASLHTQVNANGLATTLRFEYLSEAAFQANLGAVPPREGFAGASRAAAGGSVSSLTPGTTYRYRAVATNSAAPGGVPGPAETFTTEEAAVTFSLPDGRGWEMVSPIDKNGGAVQGPGQNFGGAVLQAAAQGGEVTYSSASSFGQGAQGAPAASQYLAGREGGGWSRLNITAPQRSGAEPQAGAGVPYRVFSPDLSTALVFDGGNCLSVGVGCADPSSPPPGSGAPAGYQNYYLRSNGTGAFQALITTLDSPALSLPAEAFSVSLAGTTPDLGHVVISTCARLTPEATEVPDPPGCNPAEPNLYEWSGGGLALLNLLPGDAQGTPGAKLAAPAGAISADGSRVYFSDGEDSPLYLREAGGPTKLLPESGGTEAFQAASADGKVAFFTKAGTLYRYIAASGSSEPLAAEIQGVLGASEDGSRLYYATSAGLFLWRAAAPSTPIEIAPSGSVPAADPTNYPPATGTARLSPDGSHLLFSSAADLTGYDNTDSDTGDPDSELYLYDAGAGSLTCVSCNPTNERPIGSADIPGAVANGIGALATQTYKPRVLSATANRVFFDSEDALALQDTNHRADVYEWETEGAGTCAKLGGCIRLISSGRDGEASEFIDASADGADAFFLTAASLVPSDPGSFDLYDAREGGGFAVPPTPIPCVADACQSLPSPPEDPTPGTLVPSPGNSPLHFTKAHRPKKHHKKKHGKNHHREQAAGPRRRPGK